MIFIGQRLQRVPHWQQGEQGPPSRQGVRGRVIYHPKPAVVVYINEAHHTYTVKYEKTGFLETFKMEEDI